MVTSSLKPDLKEKINSPISNFIKGHKRSTSHHNFVKPVQEFENISKNIEVFRYLACNTQVSFHY